SSSGMSRLPARVLTGPRSSWPRTRCSCRRIWIVPASKSISAHCRPRLSARLVGEDAFLLLDGPQVVVRQDGRQPLVTFLDKRPPSFADGDLQGWPRECGLSWAIRGSLLDESSTHMR